jgi:thiol-disulfide isomerase/thioredoxin
MKKVFLSTLVLLAVGLLATGCGHIKKNSSETPVTKTTEAPAKKGMNSSNASYENYTAERFNELKGSQKFVAFFYAEWCSTCRKWEKKITDGLSQLPDDAVILQVDFDTEKDLAKMYDVKMQSTAVFFDEMGNVTNTAGDPSLEVVSAHF